MATVNPESSTSPVTVRSLLAAIRRAFDRPLTSYYLLLGASAMLLTIGLIMVLSASSVRSFETYDGDSYYIVKRQLLWVLLGIPAAWAAARLPQNLIRQLSWLALPVSMALLALTRLGFGLTRNGNTNWVGLGPVVIQPSEFAKLALVIWAAHVYANKDRALGQLRHILLPVLPGALLVIALVLWQRDLGTGLVLIGIVLAMFWIVGAPTRMFAVALSLGGVITLYLAATSPERRSRLVSFTDPFSDYHFSGWQPAHGLYALSSGGWFGRGIGASQQKWGALPYAHTDYIFAVLGEELGLIGTLLVLGLFLTIAYAGFRVALATADPFVRYATFGVLAWLLGQAIINLGMVLALLPVIGIPLPLVSYGGSALVPSLMALGLLVGFARREPTAAAALAARRDRHGG